MIRMGGQQSRSPGGSAARIPRGVQTRGCFFDRDMVPDSPTSQCDSPSSVFLTALGVDRDEWRQMGVVDPCEVTPPPVMPGRSPEVPELYVRQDSGRTKLPSFWDLKIALLGGQP